MSDTAQLGISEQIFLTLPRGRRDEILTEVDVDKPLVAPLIAGSAHGTVRLTLDGEELYSAPLVALQDVEQAGFFSRLWDGLVMWFTGFFSDLSSE